MEKEIRIPSVFVPQVDDSAGSTVFKFGMLIAMMGAGCLMAIIFTLHYDRLEGYFLYNLGMGLGATLTTVGCSLVALGLLGGTLITSRYLVKPNDWVWEITTPGNEKVRLAPAGLSYRRDEYGRRWSDDLFQFSPRMERTITCGSGDSAGKVTVLVSSTPNEESATAFLGWLRELEAVRSNFIDTVRFLEASRDRDLPFKVDHLVRN